MWSALIVPHWYEKLSLNVHPRDVRESVDVTPESDLPPLSALGPELSLNGINDQMYFGINHTRNIMF